MDGRHHRLGEALRDLGNFEADDRQLLVGRREVDEEMEAPPLEPVRELPRVVRGQDHERDVGRLDRPELRHRHLEIREDLQQEGLELRLGLVDLVDEQDDGLDGLDGLQQRPGGEKAMGEEGVVLT